MSDFIVITLVTLILLSSNSDVQYSNSTTSQVIENGIKTETKTDYSYGLCWESIIPVGYYGTANSINIVNGVESLSFKTIECAETKED